MGTFTEVISGNEILSYVKKGLVADGTIPEDTEITIRRRSRDSWEYVVTFEADDINGNEKEWKKKEGERAWKEFKGLLMMLGLIIGGFVLMFFVLQYGIPFMPDSWILR